MARCTVDLDAYVVNPRPSRGVSVRLSTVRRAQGSAAASSRPCVATRRCALRPCRLARMKGIHLARPSAKAPAASPHSPFLFSKDKPTVVQFSAPPPSSAARPPNLPPTPAQCRAAAPLPSFNLQEYSPVLTAWQFGHRCRQSVLRRPPSPARRQGGRRLLRRPGQAHL
jgi:hypothetical protein